MIKIFMNGCCGRMGRVIGNMVKEYDDCEIVAGGDVVSTADGIDFPIFTNPMDCDVDFDVIIDFSHFSAVPAILELALAKKKPIVVCTTAIPAETIEKINEASKVIPVFKSANMSVGMNVLFELVRQATKALYPGYDIEIVEAHHNRKLDAPSGTAMTISDVIRGSIDNDMELVFDRHSKSEKRKPTEIGMSAIRGGNIVGDHDVYFISDEETVKISHSAHTRDVFGRGAIKAAKYVVDKEPGMYDMENIVSALFNK
ncbi:MAG: 4-hydroxy-tetrahydrodipicolinate reductase [Saccharofermentans sp.]|nr:4-hydroxy-tetrahydrodipicolinate reductase [Saccharofermentans sp.]